MKKLDRDIVLVYSLLLIGTIIMFVVFFRVLLDCLDYIIKK
jgi:hypothetical protein